MEIKIKKTDLGQYLEVDMKEGEKMYVEPGAIISMKGEVDIISKLSGGLVTSALRMFGGSESLFINEIVAKTDAVVELGPTIAGEILELDLDGEMLLGDGVYLAHTGDITVSASFGGFNSLVAGSGLMFLTAKGKGKLYLSGGESIIKKEIKKGEVFYLDNTAFLCAPSHIKLEKKLVGKGITSKIFGGEGFMFKITGPVTMYYQTQSPSGLVRYLQKFLPKR